MVTKKVIKEIYKKYHKPPHNHDDLNIPHYLELLKDFHHLVCEDGEILDTDLDDFNPFKRMRIQSLHAILEFDKVVAFVFVNHILFFDKYSENMHIHFKPEKKGFLSRLFGKKN